MKYELKEISLNMGKAEYDMYQDIPSKELGSTNLCKGLPYEVFDRFLENEISKKYQVTTRYCTPTTIYIFYVNDKPVGLIGLRTDIDDNWKKWSGNIYYVIRESERKKGYGTILLREGLKKLHKLGFEKVYASCPNTNFVSSKVMEKNNGILIKEDVNSRFYEFKL